MGKQFYRIKENNFHKFSCQIANQVKNRYVVIGKTSKDSSDDDLNKVMSQSFNVLKGVTHD